MTWNNPPRRTLRVLLCMAALAMASACTVSYKFTGTSIDAPAMAVRLAPLLGV